MANSNSVVSASFVQTRNGLVAYLADGREAVPGDLRFMPKVGVVYDLVVSNARCGRDEVIVADPAVPGLLTADEYLPDGQNVVLTIPARWVTNERDGRCRVFYRGRLITLANGVGKPTLAHRFVVKKVRDGFVAIPVTEGAAVVPAGGKVGDKVSKEDRRKLGLLTKADGTTITAASLLSVGENAPRHVVEQAAAKRLATIAKAEESMAKNQVMLKRLADERRLTEEALALLAPAPKPSVAKATKPEVKPEPKPVAEAKVEVSDEVLNLVAALLRGKLCVANYATLSIDDLASAVDGFANESSKIQASWLRKAEGTVRQLTAEQIHVLEEGSKEFYEA